MSHIASACPNMNQVQAAESYITEEVNYARDVYRNQNSSYPQNRSYPSRNVPYPNNDAYPPAPRERLPPAPEQRVPPYRHPGHQEQARPSMPSNEDLRSLILDMSNKLDIDRRSTAEGLQGLRTQLKGVNAHLGDIDAHLGELDTWKKNVDTQLGHLA